MRHRFAVRHRLARVARVVVPLLVLAWLVHRLGAQALRPALAVISPVPIVCALVLGGVAVFAQAARWRVVLHGLGLSMTHRQALAECYRAGALNTVLPGGMAGDVLRAWRQRTGARNGWRPGAASVLAERAAGLSLLLATAAVVLAFEVSLPLAAAAAGGSCVALAVSWPSLRRLRSSHLLAVWGWSAVALAALLGLAAVAGAAVGVSGSLAEVATLGLGLLAGMAVPLNVAGWGPREAAGALTAVLLGAAPATGVAVAVGYGLLATVSALPGLLVLVEVRSARSGRGQPLAAAARRCNRARPSSVSEPTILTRASPPSG